MPKFYRFVAVDAEGESWTVPAESIKSPFKGHDFVIHRSLKLDGPAWTVSHLATGAAVISGESKIETIALALAKLRSVTARQIDAIAQDALRRRAVLANAPTDTASN